MKLNKNMFRIVIGLGMALIFGLITYVGVAASPPRQDGDPPMIENLEDKCQACHPAIHVAWENSAHGHATDDPVFQSEWNGQSKPRECLLCHTTGYDPETNTWEEDGITCLACHEPISENHPIDPMPSNRSATLCEKCHSQTVIEWQLSVHRKSGLDCVDCHGQHSTDLKVADASSLCASCHRERASNFAHSVHSEQNLTCVDCHLETVSEGSEPMDGTEGHSAKDHSFRPKLDACNECHSYQMHDPMDVHAESGLEGFDDSEADLEVQAQGINVEPDPVNPITFALISGLVGMIGGLLIAPWIQEWYQKFDFSFQVSRSKDEKGDDEQ